MESKNKPARHLVSFDRLSHHIIIWNSPPWALGTHTVSMPLPPASPNPARERSVESGCKVFVSVNIYGLFLWLPRNLDITHLQAHVRCVDYGKVIAMVLYLLTLFIFYINHMFDLHHPSQLTHFCILCKILSGIISRINQNKWKKCFSFPAKEVHYFFASELNRLNYLVLWLLQRAVTLFPNQCPTSSN